MLKETCNLRPNPIMKSVNDKVYLVEKLKPFLGDCPVFSKGLGVQQMFSVMLL